MLKGSMVIIDILWIEKAVMVPLTLSEYNNCNSTIDHVYY